mgnify:CR=1 FL=1
MSHDGQREFEASKFQDWLDELALLNWSNMDRSEVLNMLLEAYDMSFADAIEDVLNSEQGGNLKLLIETIKSRKKGIIND